MRGNWGGLRDKFVFFAGEEENGEVADISYDILTRPQLVTEPRNVFCRRECARDESAHAAEGVFENQRVDVFLVFRRELDRECTAEGLAIDDDLGFLQDRVFKDVIEGGLCVY